MPILWGTKSSEFKKQKHSPFSRVTMTNIYYPKEAILVQPAVTEHVGLGSLNNRNRFLMVL